MVRKLPSTNHINPIDLEEDVPIIYPQYKRDYNSDFFEDMATLSYKCFYLNIYGLTGDYKEILRLRDALLNGKKLEKGERKVARNVLSKSQKKKYESDKQENMIGTYNSIGSHLANKFK